MSDDTGVRDIPVSHAEIFRLEAGDRLAVHSDRLVTMEQADRIKNAVAAAFGIEVNRVLVLGPGLELKVIRE